MDVELLTNKNTAHSGANRANGKFNLMPRLSFNNFQKRFKEFEVINSLN